MTNSEENISKLLEKIFMNYAVLKRQDFLYKKLKFVHYTSAENALSIIKNKEFWLRNAKCMNDYNEIQHGHEMLIRYFENSASNINRARFIDVFDSIQKDIALKTFSKFDEWWNRVNYNTFIGSISEHMENESVFGRLSMWRAYGKNSAKAALILNIPLEDSASLGLENVFLIPVSYFDENELEATLNCISANVASNLDFLKTVSVEKIENILFLTLVMLSVSLKHKGFSEEREWRVVYLPLLYGASSIKETIEVISGIPQKVCKIELVDCPEKGASGLGVEKLISEVLIGPTEYPSAIFDAFSDILGHAGVENAWERVKVSNIPLRVNS